MSGTSQNTGGAQSGSYSVAAPLTPGDYEFRYLQSDGTTDVARSNPVAVLGATSFTWDSENRLAEIVLPEGGRNTMSYRADGLRHRLFDSEGDKRMVWDSLGSSGYVDLIEEN